MCTRMKMYRFIGRAKEKLDTIPLHLAKVQEDSAQK